MIESTGVRSGRWLARTSLALGLWLAGVVPVAWSSPQTLDWKAGDVVVMKGPEVLLRIGRRVVTSGEIHRVYTVEKVQEGWLWVSAPELAGWVKADQVTTFEQAMRDADARIAEGAELARAHNQRGLLWADQGRIDLAIQDYSKAIELDPNYGAAYLNRGLASQARGDLEQAARDLDAAAERSRLDPLLYYNRAHLRLSQGEYERAMGDLDLTIRLSPAHSSAWFNRAAVALLTNRPVQAAGDSQMFLKMVGWKETQSPYAALIGWVGARQAGQEELAKTILSEARQKWKPEIWPGPIFGYLAGEQDLETVLNQAVSEDQKAEARVYAGIALDLAGKSAEADEQFQWVVQNSDPSRIPHAMAQTFAGAARSDNAAP